MDTFQQELLEIKAILKDAPQGLSITEIARLLKKNNHSVGRYLDNLLVSGQVEMRVYGKAKVFTLSTRVPIETMMSFADDLILVLDQDNRILRLNNHLLVFFNKTKHDFIGKNLQALAFSEKWINSFFDTIRQSMISGKNEIEILCHRGDDVIFRQKNIPSVFENGKKGTIILLEDITARRKADNALRESEERFRLMAENIKDGILIREGQKTVFINKRTEEIFGYTREEFTSLPYLSIAAPEERERLQKAILESGNCEVPPPEITLWIQRKDGTRRFINNRITSNTTSDKTTYYVISTDITEWKHVHDALENQLNFLQHMIDTFPNPLFYLDINGRFLGCNTAFTRLLQKTSQEIIGKTCNELTDLKNAMIFQEYTSDLIKNLKVFTHTGQFIRPDGGTTKITIQKSGLTLSDGKIVGIIGLILNSETLE